jgi:para-nitrobenzyl esterase
MTLRRVLAAAVAVCLSLAPAGAVQGQPATAPDTSAADGPVVRTAAGAVRGTVSDGVARFQGVPFAAPPVGDLRWRAPQPAPAWAEVRDASRPAIGCARQEDCLYLNVTRPADAKAGAKLPVMVWIHGGAFAIGDSTAGFGAVHDGGEFANKGIVLVTVNYRLGRAGWFAHPALTKAGGPVGNYGLMDQIEALKWVQRNIAAFGGDPGNVTVFGESAGGISILFLMLAPDAKGLFHKAIVESGFARTQPRPLKVMEDFGAAAAARAGVTGDDEAAATALRSLPLAALASGGPLIGAPDGPFPILDGRLITGGIAEGFAAGRQMKIPLIIGGNSNEASLVRPKPEQLAAIGDRAGLSAAFDPEGTGDSIRLVNDLVTAQLVTEPDRNLARIHSRTAPTWLYYFSYVPPERRAASRGAGHTAEIRYVFGGPAQKLAPDEAPLARAMNAYWAAFARSGAPAFDAGPAWPTFKTAGEPTLEFGSDGIAVRERHLATRLDWVEENLAK